jgi:uncharacterized Zn-finger protein
MHEDTAIEEQTLNCTRSACDSCPCCVKPDDVKPVCKGEVDDAPVTSLFPVKLETHTGTDISDYSDDNLIKSEFVASVLPGHDMVESLPRTYSSDQVSSHTIAMADSIHGTKDAVDLVYCTSNIAKSVQASADMKSFTYCDTGSAFSVRESADTTGYIQSSPGISDPVNVEEHDASDRKLFRCAMCVKSFNKKAYLARHMQRHTGLVQGTQATTSHSKCTARATYSVNVEEHETSDGKLFQCGMCVKTFNKKSYLTRHMQRHTGDKQYQCEICMKAFFQKSGLATHLRMHTGEKPYKCALCPKAFSENSTLINHVRVHTGDKPFKCDLCEKSFCKKCHLVSHRNMHTGFKPHMCNFCAKSFSEKSNLVNHMRVHTGERPYQCELCDKSFSEKGSLA